MRSKLKDRIVDLLLVLLFGTLIGGSAYLIFKIMIKWSVEGLG